MARKRMVDPSIWTDEGMTALTPRQQLLYIGLFSNADDAGRLRGSPKAIRMTLPTIYARVKDGDIEKDLDAVLGEMRRLVRYEVDDRQYLEFQNYAKWQRIDRPSESALPLNRAFVECSPNDRGALDLRLVEEKLVEEKLVEEKHAPSVATEPSRKRSAPAKVSFAPLVEAFRARGLADPTFMRGETPAAQALLKIAGAEELAECWSDIVSGFWPPGQNTWERSNLSFATIANNNRLGNWRTWKLQGKPQAQERVNGARSTGQSGPDAHESGPGPFSKFTAEAAARARSAQGSG